MGGHHLTRRRFLQVAAGAGLGTALPGLRSDVDASTEEVPVDGEWLAGDFHVHTTYSHDVWGGPGDDNTPDDERHTLGWTPAEQIVIAEARGLDFVALTDHNRTDALRDPAYRSGRVTLVPGYEHSLNGGHAGVFMPDRDLLLDIVRDADGSTDFGADDASLQRFFDLVHDNGGAAVLNHPKDKGGWRRAISASLGFDAVEAWNGRWQQRADIMPAAWTNNYEAVPWYEDSFLRDHHRRIGVAGGSDNHWRSVTALAGAGQPTTWVYAADRSPAAIIDAVKLGRTFVSHEPPAHLGPRLFLEAAEDWRNGKTAIVGGDVRSDGPLAVTVRIENGAGNRLRLISTGQVIRESLVALPTQSVTTTVVLPAGGWLRAELLYDAGYAMTALTSPIFASDRAPAWARTDVTIGAPVTYDSPPTTLPEIACDC